MVYLLGVLGVSALDMLPRYSASGFFVNINGIPRLIFQEITPSVRVQAGGRVRVNALAKAGIELGENGSIFPRPKGKARSQIKETPTDAVKL